MIDEIMKWLAVTRLFSIFHRTAKNFIPFVHDTNVVTRSSRRGRINFYIWLVSPFLLIVSFTENHKKLGVKNNHVESFDPISR